MAMTTVYSNKTNAVRTTIEAQGLLLAVFKQGERNKIIRYAMEAAGWRWIALFLSKRFTPYVVRSPFNYPKRPVKLALTKLRADNSIEMQTKWAQIKNREFDGWDPWSSAAAPVSLIQRWRSQRPGEYKTKRGSDRTSREENKLIYADIRRWAKKRSAEIAGNLVEDGHILPLVDSGVLRKTALSTAKSKGVSTQKKTQTVITIPRAGRQNRMAVRILGELPSWEFDAFVKALNESLALNITEATNNRPPKAPKTNTRAPKPEPRKVG